MTPQRRLGQSLGPKVVPDSVMPMTRISREASGMNRRRGLGTQSYQSSPPAPLLRSIRARALARANAGSPAAWTGARHG
jgi:hypothetical protein